MRVGFVGVGSMGTAMLERVLAGGHGVSFYARRPEVVAEVARTGATSVPSLRELAAGSDIVVVCVFTDAQVHDVCDGGLLEGLADDAVLVLHTTCSPRTPVALGERALVLDAAFSGGPDDAAAGMITLLAGGDDDVLKQVRPVLSTYCDPILHVGALGDGQRVKLLNNAMFGASVGIVVEAERVAQDLGLDPAKAFAAVARCSGNSFALGHAVAMGSAQNLMAAAGKYIVKDIATVRELAAEAGTDLGVLDAAASAVSA